MNKLRRREFLKRSGLLASTIAISDKWNWSLDGKLRTAHIGVGNMGKEDLMAIASHKEVVVTALCDVHESNGDGQTCLLSEAFNTSCLRGTSNAKDG